MSATAQNTRRAALRDGIQMELITPRAEKQSLQLSTTDRRRFARFVAQPIAGNRCRRITTRGKFSVYHFDVTDTVRCSYRMVNGQACILHVGTHPKFDEFASRYGGTLPQTLIPVKESLVMSKHRNNTKPVTKPEAETPCAPVLDGAELISHAIFGLFQKAFAGEKQRFEEDMFTLAESVRVELNDKIEDFHHQFEGYTQQVATIDAGLAKHKKAVNVRLNDEDARLAGIEESLSAEVAQRGQAMVALAGDIRKVDKSVNTLRSSVDRRLTELSQELAVDRTAPLQDRLAQLAADTVRLHDEIARRDSRVTHTSQLVSGCQEEIAGLRALLSTTQETVSAFSGKVDTVQEELRELSTIIAQQRQEQAERSLKTRLTRLARAGHVHATKLWSRTTRLLRGDVN